MEPAKTSPQVIIMKVAAVVACAAMADFGLRAQWSWLNGPAYWKWPYQNLDAGKVYFWFALAALPTLAGAWLGVWRPSRHWPALGLMMLGLFGLQLANLAVQTDLGPVQRAGRIVGDVYATGYFDSALLWHHSGARLDQYVEMMPRFAFHARTKPCGLVLIHVPFFSLPTPEAAKQTAAVAWLIASLLSVPATYLFIKRFNDRTAALLGAAMIALAPGMVGFAVMFDPIYPALTAAMILTWDSALTKQRDRDAVIFGLVLAAVVLLVNNLLILGALLAAMTVWRWRQGAELRKLARLAAVALQTVFSICLVIGVTTGYSVIEAFHATLQAQAKSLGLLNRPWRQTVFFDLYDFAWAGSWVVVLLTGFALCGALKQCGKRAAVLVMLGLGQIVLTAVTGLLQTETMRVWLFLLPLLLLPASLELARWPRWAKAVALAAVWWMCVSVNQHFVLIRLL